MKACPFAYTFLFIYLLFYPNEKFYYPWFCKEISTNQKANYPI